MRRPEHRAIALPVVLPPLMALPLPGHVVVDLPGLVPVLEHYEYVAERQRRHEEWEARRLAWRGEFADVGFPEWSDDGRVLSQEKAKGVAE